MKPQILASVIISVFLLGCESQMESMPEVRSAELYTLFYQTTDRCPENLDALNPQATGPMLPFRHLSDVPGSSRAVLFQWFVPSMIHSRSLFVGRSYDRAVIYLDGERDWWHQDADTFRGFQWKIAPLPDKGVEVTVCFEKGDYYSFASPGPLDPLLVGRGSDLVEFLVRSDLDDIAITSISLAVGLVCLGMFAFLPPFRLKGILRLSLLLTSMGLYVFFSTNISQLLITIPVVRLLFYQLTCALFPGLLCMMLSQIFETRWPVYLGWFLFAINSLLLMHSIAFDGLHPAGPNATFSGGITPVLLTLALIESVRMIFRGGRRGWALLLGIVPFFLAATSEYLGVVFTVWGSAGSTFRWGWLLFEGTISAVVLVQANQLRERSERSKEQAYESGRSVAENRYRTLQERMAPHFLFNSLNLIHSYIERGNPRAGDSILMLAAHYRYLINDMERRLVRFDQEWDFSVRYSQLVQFRFEDHLRIEMDRTGDFSAVMIPPLTIQPVIENAYKHGLRDYTSKGVIEVFAEAAADGVTIRVLDNGRGVDQNSVFVSSLGGVERRLKDNFREARITMTRRKDRGTSVEIYFSLEAVDYDALE
ncbi:MAG: histidine kinase [Leptospiraceae bacterium]|nr:histidine kinase [Leptospiraceae bacterium]MCB1305276.1 histidine kinase [Leptospiraceae bacterium]